MLTYSIITPERTVAEGAAQKISVSTLQGEITLLPGHAELIARVIPGEMRIVSERGEVAILAVSTGLLRIAQNTLTILADTAERSEELALEAIERAKQAADEALRNVRAGDDVAYASAAAALERELARYRVAIKYRRK